MAKKTEVLEIEEALKRLDEILSKLESGDMSLSESLTLYEEGMTLSVSCKTILEKAEQKIETLSAKISKE